MQKYYFNFYLQDRRYGGPEEGGWFYDWYEFQCTLVSKSFASYKEANDYASEYAERIREGQEPVYHTGHGSHDGVNDAGEGDDAYLLRDGSWGEDEVYVSAELLPGKPGCKPGYWYSESWHDDNLPVPVPQERPFYE